MPEIVTPEGAPEPEVTSPDDFGSEVLARFEQRTSTSAAPMDEMGIGQPFPGGVTVDASDQFAAMAAEINKATASGDEPDDEPEGEPTDEPAPEETPAEPVEEEAAPVVDLGGYVWSYLDPSSGAPAAQRYTDVQVQQALQVAAWANNLPEDLRYALGAVEAGQAVPIARADYDRYQAWLNTQDRRQRDDDLSKLDVDPDVAKLIGDLRDQVNQLQGQQAPQQQAQPGPNPNVTNALMQAVSNYRQARQLSQEEVDVLVQTAVNTGMVGHFQQQRQQVNPVTGQVLVPADPTAVMYEALDYSLYRNPALHAAVVSRTTQPQPVLTGTPDQATAPDASVTDITAKRARAASLSAAPSAVVTPAPRTVTAMSESDRVNGMAEELARAMSG